MRMALIAMMIWIWPDALYADTVHPDAFAYGLRLFVDKDGALYQVALPRDVYQNAVHGDLSDLRVFNASDEAVPFMLRMPPKERSQASEPVILPFFPIYKSTGQSEQSLSLNFKTNASGAIIMLADKTRPETASLVEALLIDASRVKNPIRALQLRWEGADEHFITTVRVWASQDLTQWRLLVPAATLTDMVYGEHQLQQRRIELPRYQAPYLRLAWPAGVKNVRLTEIRAAVFSEPSARPRRLLAITGVRNQDHAKAFDFDSQGVFPIDRINIRLPQINSLVQAAVKSRPNKEGPWREQCRGVFYHLRLHQAELRNPALTSPLTNDRYWRVEILSDDSGMGGGAPGLELGWRPHDLVFLARGQAPFTLAFGSARIQASAVAGGLMLERIGDQTDPDALIRPAHIKERIQLGGPSQLIPEPPPKPWKQWLLWGVLIAGVVLLGLMAWNLYRQMDRS